MAQSGKRKFRTALFILEILILLLFIGALYVYGQLDSKLDKVEQPVFDEERVIVNPDAPNMTGYSTYALFGIDHRDKNEALDGNNSDTIIIASVNNDTKDVKLVSVYRDTLLNLGDGTYAKANAAYAYGGPEQAITMLNTNLDLNITDYVTVDFSALTEVADALGGLDIPLSYAEAVHMNNYCKEVSEETGKSYEPIDLPEEPEDIETPMGVYHLNGVQVTSYCRIRYTASLDMGRTERQRLVLQMLAEKAKSAGLTTLFDLMDKVFPLVTTSLTKTEILQMMPSMIGYSMNDTTGFPQDYKFSNVRGSIIVATSLESNVVKLHEFLYGSAITYTPSSEVVSYSAKILEIVGGEEQLDDVQIITSEEENTANDNFIWSESTGSNWDYSSWDSESEESDGNEGGYEEIGGNEGDYEENGGNEGGYEEIGGNEGGYEEIGGNEGGYEESGGDEGGGDEEGGYIEPSTGEGEPPTE